MNSRTMFEQPVFKVLLVVVLGALVAIACAIPAGAAQAKTVSLGTAKGTVHLYPTMCDGSDFLFVDYSLRSGSGSAKTPKNVKVSNKRVCSASAGPGEINMFFEKVGTTTLRYKWKGKNHKVKLVLHPWENPVRSIKVGNKQYAGKLKKSSAASSASKYLKGRVQVKAASGWKIAHMEAGRSNGESKPIKNGKNLTSSKKYRWVTVWLKNKRSGQEVWVDLAGKGFHVPM